MLIVKALFNLIIAKYYRGGIFIVTQRNHKDRLFIRIFQDRKNLLELYNAVNGSHYDNPDNLAIVMLEDAIYLSMKNDLSFIISSELNLYEHQSTICPDMPLRGFLYIAKQFQGLISDRPNALYSSRLIRLPTPRYIVFYNGEQPQPDRQILKLSDSFDSPSESCVECLVEVLNINCGHNEKLQHEKSFKALAKR